MGLHTMSEVPSGSWDSPQQENFARSAGRKSGAYRAKPTAAAAAVPPEDDESPARIPPTCTPGTPPAWSCSARAARRPPRRCCSGRLNAEPGSRSVREALARAQFDTGQYAAAADNFRQIVEASPTDDYAHFGLGLSLARAGDHEAAAEYLALAAAMRPDRKHYTDALRQVRATLKFRGYLPGGTTVRTAPMPAP